MSGSDSPTFFHGQPWSSWIERIGRDKPLSDDEGDIQPSSSVTRLASEDIDLYGFCPERDTFYGVVCELCNAIVKPQALIQHMETRHPSGTVNFPTPPTPIVKPPAKTPYCKVSKLKKSQSSVQVSGNGSGSSSNGNGNSKINHSIVKRPAEQQASSGLSSSLSGSSPRSPLESIPESRQTSNSAGGPSVSINSPVKSPGTGGATQQQQQQQQQAQQHHRRKRFKADRSLLKDREYDPDRHCGVWNEETGKPCTRSLTCKAHTVSLRRTVIGRSKTFDKLLAEHRAAKEVPARPSHPKLLVTGTVALSSASSAGSSLNPLAPNTPASGIELEAPSSPPVLSLPDTYPLPKAVDLLYRCLAPHGSTKPTKLEEEFDASEELRSLESSLVAPSSTGSQQSTSTGASMMAPISVVLPSLSPIPTSAEESSPVASLVPAVLSPSAFSSSSSSAVQPTSALPATCPPISVDLATILQPDSNVLDGKNGTDGIPVYSPHYKDSKSQLVVQMPRANNHVQSSPVPRNYQQQIQAASMPSLSIFEPMEQLEQQHASQINGKRLNHATHVGTVVTRPAKRSKHNYHQEYSTAIQVEATTTSTSYPHFNDITWSNCHPEPLAVSRWLRINSSRKQYNFNIH